MRSPAANPDNLLGVDYGRPPARRLAEVPVVDAHVHLRGDLPAVRRFARAARLYGVSSVLSMSFLEDTGRIEQALPGFARFVAIPDFRVWERTAGFRRQWCRDIRRFALLGARVCKFWAAPRALAERGLTLDDPWLRPVIDAALDARMGFMVHVADPDLWYATRYADAARYGTKSGAYQQLEWFCDYVSGRPVIGAHFAGHPEDLDHLDQLLADHANLMLDTSATRWVAREASRHRPARVRRFFRDHRERILFGSDLVVGGELSFAHYASRYWVQQMLWESGYEGDSPISDPDLPRGRAQLRGVRLPDESLRAIYQGNFRRLMTVLEAGSSLGQSPGTVPRGPGPGP